MLRCLPCGKTFTGKENYDQHIKSDKHNRKILQLCLLRKQTGTSDDVTGKIAGNLTDGVVTSKPELNDIKCEICNILFDTFEDFHRHSVTLEHALKVHQKASSNNDSYSNVSSTTDADNYKVQNSSNDMKQDDEMLIEFNVGPQNSSSISCDLCNKSFNGSEPYKQHIESEKHKKAQRNILVDCKTNSYNYELHDTENDMKLEVVADFDNICTRSQYSSSLWCDVCKKGFTGLEPYKQHNASENHKKKVALQKNSSTDGMDLSITQYSCETCDKTFNGEAPYKQHIESERHKKKRMYYSQPVQHFQPDMNYSPGQEEKSEVDHTNDFTPWFCQVCKIQCSGMVPYQQHLKGSAHNKKSNNKLKSDFHKMPPIQESNCNANGALETLDNIPKLLNGSIQKNDQKVEEDTLMSEIETRLNVVDTFELQQLIKTFLPDQKIDFDKSCSKQEEISQIKEKSEKLSSCQVPADEHNNVDIRKQSDVYQVCFVCKVQLFDKDDAAQHFESQEHYKKRWGDKV